VLPHAYRKPARRDELRVSVGVPVPIALELGGPPRLIAPRLVAVLRAAVPKAAIDEYGDSSRAKDQVSAAAQTRQGGPVDPIPEASTMQLAA